MMTRSAECLSRLQCDQLLNDELAQRADLLAHAASCERCAALIEAHRRERSEFDGVLVAPRAARRRVAWSAAGLAVAAAFAVWFVVRTRSTSGSEPRIKGSPALGIYVKHRDDVRKGGPGEIVAPGDALDFAVTIDHAAYLAIVAIDARRVASVYYPEGPTAEPVQAGAEQLLPTGVVLDGVLGVEEVHAVFCARPLSVAEILGAVARGAAPPGCVSDRWILDKRGAP